jgi:two-component system, chemotaxis family, protein-glutamate methylesterase/glutaminase
MPNRDILAIGASAGGFEALRFLTRGFQSDLPAAVLIVIHLPSHYRSDLDKILTQTGPLPADFAEDGQLLEHGRIYIGRPARHLIVENDKLRLGNGPRENGSRPAIDPLFRSIALCCGPRSIGVILTGMLGDGSSGLWALKRCGGVTVVQEPSDAAFPDMPSSAIERSNPDHVVTLAAMPALLDGLVRHPAGQAVTSMPESLRYEVQVAAGGSTSMDAMDRIGRRSVLACPDCHGVMWEIDEGELVRYRCHVGHAYSADRMSVEVDNNLRLALGSALRALEERTTLVEKLRYQASASGHSQLAASWDRKAEEFEAEADVIRASLKRADDIVAKLAQDG